MSGSERRRVDLTRLPTVAAYGLALVTIAVVVGLVVLVRGGSTHVSGWYPVVVTVGAVLLIASLVVWLVRRIVARLGRTARQKR